MTYVIKRWVKFFFKFTSTLYICSMGEYPKIVLSFLFYFQKIENRCQYDKNIICLAVASHAWLWSLCSFLISQLLCLSLSHLPCYLVYILLKIRCRDRGPLVTVPPGVFEGVKGFIWCYFSIKPLPMGWGERVKRFI